MLARFIAMARMNMTFAGCERSRMHKKAFHSLQEILSTSITICTTLYGLYDFNHAHFDF